MCEHCENNLFRTKEEKALRLPDLRNKNNIISDDFSWGEVQSFLNVLVDAPNNTILEFPKLSLPNDITIGQLPGGAFRAHILIRDVFCMVKNAGSGSGYVYGFFKYKDVAGRVHNLCSFAYNNAVGVNQTFMAQGIKLMSEAVITDSFPDNIGNFVLEARIGIGTITAVSFDVRANIAIQYEV